MATTLKKYSRRMAESLREKYFPTVQDSFLLEAKRYVWFPEEEAQFVLTLYLHGDVDVECRDYTGTLFEGSSEYLAPEMVSEYLLEDGHEHQVFLGEVWDSRNPTVRTMDVNPLYEINQPIVAEVHHF